MTESTELVEFARRLNELCDDMRVPPKGNARQTYVAKLFGVSQKGARKWLEAEGYPKLEMCKTISVWAGVQVEWLLTGRGDKNIYATGISRHVAEQPRPYQDIKRSPAELARLVRKLDPDHLAIKMLDAVLDRANTTRNGSIESSVFHPPLPNDASQHRTKTLAEKLASKT